LSISCPICVISNVSPKFLRPVTIMMRIRWGGSIRYYYYLKCPFHSALEILEEVQQSDWQEERPLWPWNKILSFQSSSRPGPSRKLWKSQIMFIGCSFVFNWVDSLIV
jgi:hypothetical protein